MGLKSLAKSVVKNRVVQGAATMGGSETARALTGHDSIYDPALKAAGLGIDKAGARPEAENYFKDAEGSTAENLKRAYKMADDAAAYKTGVTVRDPGQIDTSQVQARQTDAPLSTTAHDMGAVERSADGLERVQAERVSAPILGDVERVQGRSAGPAERAGTSVIGTTERQAETDVGRAEDTSGASQMLRAAALGQVPSKAEAQLASGLDKISKKQLSLAASAKGSERRGSRRGAMLAIGEQGAEANQQAAALRADEMAHARGEFSGYEQKGQQMRQEVNNLQAQIDAARARGDADAANRMAEQQAQLDQGAKQFDAAAANARGESDTERASRADEGNAAAANARDSERAATEMRAREGNAARTTSTALDNAGRSTSANMADAAAANARAESLARRQDESDQQYAARVAAWQEQGAQRDQAAQTTNAANTLQGRTTTAQLGQKADEGNAQIQQQDQNLRQSGEGQALSVAGNAASQQGSIAGTKFNADNAQYLDDKNRETQQRNNRTQTFLKVGTSLLSDERAKEDIEPIEPASAARLADAYARMASTYTYKKGDGETTAGVMAQDLERDPLGRKFVRKDAEGMRSIDYDGLNSAVLAGLAAKLDAQTQRSAKARRA